MAASPGLELERLVAELSRLEEPTETLKTLKTAVLALPLATLRERVPQLQLRGLFSLLNGDDREQIAICVSILERLLEALEPVYVAQNFKEELQRGLFHPDDLVKMLTVSQVGRIVASSEAVAEMFNNLELLRQIILCIGGEKIAVAKEAVKSLSRIAQTKAGLEALFVSNLLNDLKNVMATSDVVRYRVYELIVEIASVSEESLDYCVKSGFISQLLKELTGDDVLVRVTCIEMVTTLACTFHGRRYLAQQGIIDKISNMIISAESDPFSGFYLPGLVKFFGNLAIVDSPQQICERYPAFVEKVLEMAEGHDVTMIGVAVDTLGILGSNVEGKQVLQKIGSRFQKVFKKLGSQAQSASTELRVRCLDAISSLLYLPPDKHTDDLLAMTASWFSCLSTQPLDLFRSISTQPFPELHCGALRVFTAIANQPWAQRLMINSPGFVEYIIDRRVDPDKPSKDAKFELVKALVNSTTAAETFGNQHYLRLRAYLRDGPYYVKAISTVAVDGAE
ncbi:26S proteasome non-ATPase regulatory subunit 5 [Ambystoma mexicanum]|uniref:26S proteasome non-ATPase regulatory subunit 5 n=1 Tax=Ambystoma mexicanum TaxID=8296 RepID=UPI0037E82023